MATTTKPSIQLDSSKLLGFVARENVPSSKIAEKVGDKRPTAKVGSKGGIKPVS